MSIERRGQSSVSSGGTLGDAFYPAFKWAFNEEGEFVNNVEKKLSEARMADNVEMFLSRAMAVGTISGVALWLIGMLVGYLLVTVVFGGGGEEGLVFIGIQLPENIAPIINALKIPFLVVITGILFGSIGFGLGFGSLVAVPYFRASARKREINVLLSDSIAFMYALSVGGLNQLEILQAMAKAEDTYGECAKEFQSIVLETEYFDTDYRTAIRNQAMKTPSDELSQFLTDMLSIVNSGGDMTTFLEDQKDKHMRTAKQEQQRLLDTLELFGEMYMTLSLFPLLLIIILVIMSMMGQAQQMLLWATVYGLIPLTGVGVLVLVSTVTQDTIGDGYLRPEGNDDDFFVDEGLGILNLGRIEEYTGEYSIFDRVRSREGNYEMMQIIKQPHVFFRDHPLMVLAITVPLTILALVIAILNDWAPLSLEGMVAEPVKGTFFWLYVPIYINLLPLAIFHEWNVRSRRSIIGNISENLRKLASANDTGMTLLESLKVVSDTSAGKLSKEFEVIHAKVNYGTSLKDALREFNNKYHVPRMARTVKLISEAQEASSQIQDVLSTAAQSSENQDDIDRERISRTRMQVVIILMTYLTLLGVMALLKTQFLGEISTLSAASEGSNAGPASQFGGNLDADLISMMFFHAVTFQALLSSFIAGYIRDVSILSGVKFAVVLSTIALVVWMII